MTVKILLSTLLIIFFQTTAEAWSPIPGALVQVSAAVDGTVMGLSANGTLFQYVGSNWIPVPEPKDVVFSQITVGSANDIWALSSKSNSSGNIYQYNGSGLWTQTSGSLVQVSAGSDGTIMGLTASGHIYEYINSKWAPIAGEPNVTYKQIAIGGARNIWAFTSTGVIYNYNGTWNIISFSGSGTLKQVAAASDGTVWGLTSSNALYKYVGNSWTAFAGPSGGLTQLAVNNAGEAWGVNAHQNIFEYADAIVDPCLPITMPTSTALFYSTHRTFAHYFYSFPLSMDNLPASEDWYTTEYLNPAVPAYAATGGHLRTRPLPVTPSTSPESVWLVTNMEREVEMAIARGITGFELDIMDVSTVIPNPSHPQYQPVLNLIKAAQAVDPRFLILIMPDMSILSTADVITIVKSLYNSPGLYRQNGKLVISPFDSQKVLPPAWKTVLQTLATAGYPVEFLPTLTSLPPTDVTSYAAISYTLGTSTIYTMGMSDWATPTPSQLTWYPANIAEVHSVGLPIMEALGAQEYRPYASLYYEANNSLTYRNGWVGSMSANMAVIDTWSDLSEGASIEPVTDVEGTSGNGYYNLTGYYASWFASGVKPTIDHDVLYYFYRKEPTDAAAPKQTSLAKLSFGTVTNEIELLAFLTAPGTLSITIGSKTYTQSAPAGMTSFTVPTQPGTPRFSLVRSGAEVISFQSGPQIYGVGGLPNGTQDLTYWSGSASSSGVCTITPPNP